MASRSRKLAGLPPSVVKRARTRSRPRGVALEQFARRAAAVLLRAARAARRLAPDELRTALAALDPDALTPREALEALYKLKRLPTKIKEYDQPLKILLATRAAAYLYVISPGPAFLALFTLAASNGRTAGA